MWYLKYDTDKPIYERETDSQIQRTGLWLSRKRGVGGGMEREVGVSRSKLLYIEQVNKKVLLYSTGSYIQYPMINNGK